ncbi:MAG: pyridoxal phosphate-dependent aminotransferase [Oscillospiraceae bacterium]|jgi:aspartate aminotransferase|nr:pyridoxal phosphate-dependent aminotransferase [Oscillospiraceae bacterium]
MISSKMLRLTETNSVIRAMFEEGNRLAAQLGRENVFDFSLGNPNFPPPDAVAAAIIDILQTTPAIEAHGYMSNAGFTPVRDAIARSLNARHGTDFSAEHIIMTVGAAGGLNVALKTLINPGDEVIALAPYFVEYGNYVNNYDGVLRVVPPNIPGFQPDPEALAAAITPKTKAVIINTPNNPTGVIYSEDSIRSIAAVIEQKQTEYGAPIYILSDEPYRELAYDGAQVPYLTKYYRNSIVCYSWSKSLSLPGERIGYLAVPRDADDSALILEAAAIATRVLGFVNAPSLIQLAVARCLDESVDVAAYDANRRALHGGLTARGFECALPEGAFYMWLKAPADDDRAFAESAKRQRILLVPGTSFACPGYVRLAYCVAPSTIERSMDGFSRLAAEYGLL